ncbi:hypothetical protein [Aeromonas dhakensis]|uniref:hypothetical protein n=1 Tax=Aeromonas dhakensis TaxID=196024 RepID=UPI003BA341B5
MYKVAILCQSLRNYAGAERVVYELTQAFIREDHQVHIGCIDIGDFYHQQLAGVRINDLVDGMEHEYDLVICFHTYTLPYFFPKGVNCRKLCYFSLSPYEPIEAPLCSSQLFDSYLCNSDETKEELIRCGIAADDVYVFHNSCSFQKDAFELKQTLNRVAIVSNHPPQELLELPSLGHDLHFDYYGSDAKIEMLNDSILSKYDVVITIGYTVVFAVSAKVPVYIYDHFGGDGYLDADNYKLNSYYNFSGRPACNKKDASTIIKELKDGFPSALDSFQQVYGCMVAERDIASNFDKAFNINDFEFREILCDALQVKHALAYSKLLLSNRYLQKILDGVDSKAISQNILTLSDTVMHQARLIEKLNDDSLVMNDKINILVAGSKENADIMTEYSVHLTEHRDILVEHSAYLAENRDILAEHSVHLAENRDVLAEHRGILAENRDILSILSNDVKSMTNNSFVALLRRKIKKLICHH